MSWYKDRKNKQAGARRAERNLIPVIKRLQEKLRRSPQTEQAEASSLSDLLCGEKVAVDKPWRDYPLGTKANAAGGGYWIKEERGWHWCSGAIFPTPGGDATTVTLPTT